MNSDTTTPSFLHYALGGGLGHLVRQVAIARSLQQQTAGKSISTIVANSEFAPTVAQLVAQENDDRIRFELLPPDCLPADAENLLEGLLASQRFDCLIVDVFPRGLGGDLANCFSNHSLLPKSLPKVLIARNLPPAYLQEFQIESFVQENFCRVLRIEPEAPFDNLPQSQLMYPVVFPAEPAAGPSSLERGQRRVLVVGSGTAAECLALRELADDLRTISSNADNLSQPCEFHFHGPPMNRSDDQFCWPPSSQLAGFDLVIGNAGYNLYWETQLAQIPAILFARTRKYDDQSLRSDLHWPTPATKLLGLIESKLTNASHHDRQPPVENSIEELTTSILSLLDPC